MNINESWHDDAPTTPVNLPELRRLLHESEYNSAETEFLLKGFSEGFELGYQGPIDRKNYSHNIPFTVGNKVELWNKNYEGSTSQKICRSFC